MKNGIIKPSISAPFGFSPDLFDGWLWKMGDAVIISFIECLVPGKGHFKRLVENILSNGFAVRIPTPLGKMERIVKENGYVQSFEYDKDFGEEVEIWTKRPPADNAEVAVNSTQQPRYVRKANNRSGYCVKQQTLWAISP
jgi:hypothetical protein